MIKTGGNLTYSLDGGRLTLSLHGEIDHHSALSLRESADELIYRFRPSSAALDLSEIEFMDSSGLGFIMGRYNLMRELDGDAVIEYPNAETSRLIRLGGLEKIVPITEEQDTAPKKQFTSADKSERNVNRRKNANEVR